jgi:hypothetical protein
MESLTMRSLNPVVHNVIWPAVAGSILWGFFMVALDPWKSAGTPTIDISYYPRLLALLSGGIYLAIDWLDVEESKDDINQNYWICDLFLASAFSVFVISTQLYANSDALVPKAALITAFTIAAIGHLCGAWDGEKKKSSVIARSCYAEINLVGLAIVVCSILAPTSFSIWLTPAAPLTVIVLYLILRKSSSKLEKYFKI